MLSQVDMASIDKISIILVTASSDNAMRTTLSTSSVMLETTVTFQQSGIERRTTIFMRPYMLQINSLIARKEL